MAKTVSILADCAEAEREAIRAISSGGVLVYPTDTLYGLGCNALSAQAVRRIYQIKGREGGKPLSIIVADYPMLLEYCLVSEAQERILHALLPGPYTFILPLRRRIAASSTTTVGVRVPEHLFMRQVSKELQLPIVSTSANLSGKGGAASLADVDPRILSAADLAIDGGRCIYGIGSTVIDLVRMEIARKGAVRKGDDLGFARGD